MNWETYIAFGDSITVGARTYLGYPELVGNRLSEQLANQWNVINHAVCGFRAVDLARNIDKYYSTLKENKPSVSTILIGTNDIKEHTELVDFKIALEQVILKAKLLTTGGNVIIIPIPEFHKGITYPYSIDMNEKISVFNTAIMELADRHHIRMLPISTKKEDFLDGVHLNGTGIVTFSEQISRYILRDKGVEVV